MNLLEKYQTGSATTDEALKYFDALEPVGVDFMIGSWKGDGFHTGHPMDGLLEAYHWYGKRFESPEDVHPLLFSKAGKGVLRVNPLFIGPSLKLMEQIPMPKSAVMGRLFQFVMPLFSTTKSRARLRMTTYRGKISATMIYDQLPINDVFRRIDENTVFGIMDLKGMKKPFFFFLRRDPQGGK